MDLYLVRHEDAEEAEIDAHRSLSAVGRQRAQATGSLLAEQDGRIDLIYSSPLVRAIQTAEILALSLGLDEPLIVRPEIASPPSIGTLLRMIAEPSPPCSGLAVVGHEPTLGVLATQILERPVPLHMKKGAILCVRLDQARGKGTFGWIIVGDGPRRIDDIAQY